MTFKHHTPSTFEAIEHMTFDSETCILEVMAHTDPSRPNWAGKYGLYFNSVYESYKTWRAFKKRVLYLIEKHDLLESPPVMGSFDENGDSI